MSEQHTPTPWQTVVGKTTGREVITLAAVSKSRHVVGRFGGPDREANARLFVAAPSLLAALVDARSQLEAYEQERTGETYNDPAINTAIGAATGEQP